MGQVWYLREGLCTRAQSGGGWELPMKREGLTSQARWLFSRAAVPRRGQLSACSSPHSQQPEIPGASHSAMQNLGGDRPRVN